ncbi:MAG: WGR domain-containing protein [Acidithiobacillus sp.]|jgi:poly [ADP-ribose] polymerase|uniref:WGR domain-containing protein n=1 Tax=Acidithiobacillus sp. TaxID=1872118 RepID=UPI003560A278
MENSKAIKLIDERDDVDFTNDFEVVKFDLLNRTNIEENSNKFYIIEFHIAHSHSKFKFRVFTHYGRVGDQGVKDARHFNNEYDANSEYNRIFRQKTGSSKGRSYKKVEVAKLDVGSFKVKEKTKIAKVEVTNTNIKTQANIDIHVSEFIQRIYRESSAALKYFIDVEIKDNVISTPLGVVSQKQIDDAKSILMKIRDIHCTRDILCPTLYINEYYSKIPHKLSRNIRILSLLNTVEQVDEELEVLRIMQDIFDVKNNINDNNPNDNIVNADIKILNDNQEYDRLCKYFEHTKGHNHHHLKNSKIKRIFTSKLNSDFIRFNPNSLQVKELWHGSRNAHILGIVSKGLLINPSGIIKTGEMLGKGLYFADCSTKSLQYAATQFTGYSRSVSDCFMFLVEVAVGNILKVTSVSKIPDTLPSNYHSLMGEKGNTKTYYNTLEHNEYVIRNVNQAKISYILHIQL